MISYRIANLDQMCSLVIVAQRRELVMREMWRAECFPYDGVEKAEG